MSETKRRTSRQATTDPDQARTIHELTEAVLSLEAQITRLGSQSANMRIALDSAEDTISRHTRRVNALHATLDNHSPAAPPPRPQPAQKPPNPRNAQEDRDTIQRIHDLAATLRAHVDAVTANPTATTTLRALSTTADQLHTLTQQLGAKPPTQCQPRNRARNTPAGDRPSTRGR